MMGLMVPTILNDTDREFFCRKRKVPNARKCKGRLVKRLDPWFKGLKTGGISTEAEFIMPISCWIRSGSGSRERRRRILKSGEGYGCQRFVGSSTIIDFDRINEKWKNTLADTELDTIDSMTTCINTFGDEH